MKSKMSANTASIIVIGALKEFVTDERYFKHSSFGMEYSCLTTVGKEELHKILEVNLSLLRDSIEYDLEENAKKLIMDNLKKG